MAKWARLGRTDSAQCTGGRRLQSPAVKTESTGAPDGSALSSATDERLPVLVPPQAIQRRTSIDFRGVTRALSRRCGATVRRRSTLTLAYAEALTARFLQAPEGRNARLAGLVTFGAVDYLMGQRGVRPTRARVEDVWSFLFRALPRMGWVTEGEVPAALAELRAFWRFLTRADGASRRPALQGFLARRSTAKALVERLKAGVDDTLDMVPF